MPRVWEPRQLDEGSVQTEALTVSTAAVKVPLTSGLRFVEKLEALPIYIEAVIIRTLSSVNPRSPKSPIRSKQVDAIEAFLVVPD